MLLFCLSTLVRLFLVILFAIRWILLFFFFVFQYFHILILYIVEKNYRWKVANVEWKKRQLVAYNQKKKMKKIFLCCCIWNECENKIFCVESCSCMWFYCVFFCVLQVFILHFPCFLIFSIYFLDFFCYVLCFFQERSDSIKSMWKTKTNGREIYFSFIFFLLFVEKSLMEMMPNTENWNDYSKHWTFEVELTFNLLAVYNIDIMDGNYSKEE